ncbi:MAG TPA: DUF3298 and DUF4163 domain-containing protein [bacterium]|jgi:hypothetical protein|nr:DUF3298 and DUF4163 domain-containing protein [bacterium]
MMRFIAVTCALMAVTVFAVAPPAMPASGPAVSYVMRVVDRSDPACTAARDRCPSVTLRFPVFTQAPTTAARQALNRTVSTFMLKDFLGKPRGTVDAVIADFFQEAGEERRLNPQIPPWFLERTVAVTFNAQGIVSLRFGEGSFTGGAHPNSWEDLRSYSALSGRRLALRELLVPGFEPKLNAIAERHFRKERGLAPNDDLEAEGFTFKGGKFGLNDNFMITAKGLTFRFNSYDVAPYVLGPTEFVVPYAEIRHLVRPTGPLAAVVRR